ncbi:MAG: signal peptidase I [Clostridium beijerinckii]|nr:signal peptidase I [Clostridium beijerinckii]
MDSAVNHNYKNQGIKFLKEWVIPIAVALIIAMLIKNFLFFNIYVPSESMVPTINVDDKMVVTKIYNMGNIKRGDIIVFYSDELKETLIKRVIGLPGDHIVIHDGIVNINGNDIKEDYVKNNEKYNRTFDVPEDKFFFLGDNRPDSRDSRRWKNPYIDKSNIKGKAVFRFYPFSKMGSLSQ